MAGRHDAWLYGGICRETSKSIAICFHHYHKMHSKPPKLITNACSTIIFMVTILNIMPPLVPKIEYCTEIYLLESFKANIIPLSSN